MSNVTPIKIDTTDGRLPIKEKGLVFHEFANPAEERRNQLEKFLCQEILRFSLSKLSC